MFYYLFTYLDQAFDVPGAGVFQYITFRTIYASLTAFLICFFMGNQHN